MGPAEESEKTPGAAEKGKSTKGDLAGKVVTPIFVGLLMAFGGFVTQWTVLRISSRQENARLITNLQIQREQAEGDLRKGIFDKAFETLLSSKTPPTELRGLSDRVLKLELLALNFGDTLSLSPLFAELRRDLDQSEARSIPRSDEQIQIAALRRRLEGLARRVASSQLTSVSQYGQTREFGIPLDPNTRAIAGDTTEFRWPDDQIAKAYGDVSDSPEVERVRARDMAKLQVLRVYDTIHAITLTFQNPDDDAKTVDVDVKIKSWSAERWNGVSNGGKAPEPADSVIERKFTLDFFNFPKIDNTRLFGNQRFSVIMEKFDSSGDPPEIGIAAVIFPSEYASLKDRPGMNEAVDLMNRVVKEQE